MEIDLEHLRQTLSKKIFNRSDPKWVHAFAKYTTLSGKKLSMNCASCYGKVYQSHKDQTEKLPPFSLGTLRQKTDKSHMVTFTEFWKGINKIFKP